MTSYRALRSVSEADAVLRPLADRLVLEERDWVTAPELVEETGASYRQVDYWTRSLLLATRPGPHGTGHTRVYDLDQLTRTHAIVALLRAGIDLTAVRDHIDHLITHGGYQAGPVTITYTPESVQ